MSDQKNAIVIVRAAQDDLAAILALQKCAFVSEAEIYGACCVAPLSQTIDEIRDEFATKTFLKALRGSALIGSVRASDENGVVHIEKLIVHPDCQNQGVGRRLMQAVEAAFPQARIFRLMTGHKSLKNIQLYQKLGYHISRSEKISDTIFFVHMEKGAGADPGSASQGI